MHVRVYVCTFDIQKDGRTTSVYGVWFGFGIMGSLFCWDAVIYTSAYGFPYS
ncbi:hypothetical protein BDZ91DRAFT_708845 [Kalaharituber pfeilii]|nr:hypothetical protein BDZ91DRAFT_708845 [Kalaharituber pfeilii]